MKSLIGSSLLIGGIGSLLWSLFGGWSFIEFIGGIAQIFLGFFVYLKMQ